MVGPVAGRKRKGGWTDNVWVSSAMGWGMGKSVWEGCRGGGAVAGLRAGQRRAGR